MDYKEYEISQEVVAEFHKTFERVLKNNCNEVTEHCKKVSNVDIKKKEDYEKVININPSFAEPYFSQFILHAKSSIFFMDMDGIFLRDTIFKKLNDKVMGNEKEFLHYISGRIPNEYSSVDGVMIPLRVLIMENINTDLIYRPYSKTLTDFDREAYKKFLSDDVKKFFSTLCAQWKESSAQFLKVYSKMKEDPILNNEYIKNDLVEVKLFKQKELMFAKLSRLLMRIYENIFKLFRKYIDSCIKIIR